MTDKDSTWQPAHLDSTTRKVRLPDSLPPEPGAETPPRGRLVVRVLDGFAGLFAFVGERPYSLREHIEYAWRGRYTSQVTGPARWVQIVWAVAVSIPWSIFAYLSIWAAHKPGRAIPFLVVLLAVCTALDQVPVLQVLVPNFLDVTTWF